MSAKALLRFSTLDSIDTSTIAERSVKITDALKQLPEFVAARSVLIFAGTGHEVITVSLFESPDKSIYLPFINSLEIGLVKNLEDTDKLGKLSIPKQPADSDILERLDLVVMPGVVFSSDGNRIGRGGGWYDKFLPKLSTAIVRVGLCFSEQIQEITPEPHDQPVDVIITEEQVIRTHARDINPTSYA